MENEPKTIKVNLLTSQQPKVLKTTPVKTTPVPDSENKLPTEKNVARLLSTSPEILVLQIPRMQLDGDNGSIELRDAPIHFNLSTRGSALFNKQPNSLTSSLSNEGFQYLNISKESERLIRNILESNKSRNIERHPQIEELDENSKEQQLVIYPSQQRTKINVINVIKAQLPAQHTELQPFSCPSLISPEQPKTFKLSYMGHTLILNADRMSLSALSNVDFQYSNISKESERVIRSILESNKPRNIERHPQIEELYENPNANQAQTNQQQRAQINISQTQIPSQNTELQPFSCFSLINHNQSEAYVNYKDHTLTLNANQSEILANQSNLLNQNLQKQTLTSQTQTEQTAEQSTQATQTKQQTNHQATQTKQQTKDQTTQIGQQIPQIGQGEAEISASFVFDRNSLDLTPGTSISNATQENIAQRKGCFSSCAIS